MDSCLHVWFGKCECAPDHIGYIWWDMRGRHAFYSLIPSGWQSQMLINFVALHTRFIPKDCFVSMLFKSADQPHTNNAHTLSFYLYSMLSAKRHFTFLLEYFFFLVPTNVLSLVLFLFSKDLSFSIWYNNFIGSLFSVVCKVLLSLYMRTRVARKHIHTHTFTHPCYKCKGPLA